MSAPVTLITGLPGNGKTLYTVCMVKEWAEKEKRPVFFNGIEILDEEALPWTEIEAKDWYKVPPGSIIVLDEAHKVFPVRANGSQVPEHVLPIAELRHEGFNLVLITQHPMEIDSAVRRRVGRHLHCVRRFGMQAALIREWPRCVENCDKTDKNAIAHEWVYKKEAYGWYKSAEVHTIKRKLPAKLLWLVAASIMVPFAIWYMINFYQHQRSGDAIRKAAEANGGAASGAVVAGGPSGRVMTAQEYVSQFKPRVAGLAYTAPVYDQVTKPVRAPFPSACIQSKSRCQCYTQQGTKLETEDALCRHIVDGGFFVAWDDKRDAALPTAQPMRPSEVAPPAAFQQSGFGGFATTNRLASAAPVSTVNPPQSPQAGAKNHANAQ